MRVRVRAFRINAHQMSTFSEQGSFRITSGAIHATVPANDILVLFSFQVRLVPKSEIFTMSPFAISTLKNQVSSILATDTRSASQTRNALLRVSGGVNWLQSTDGKHSDSAFVPHHDSNLYRCLGLNDTANPIRTMTTTEVAGIQFTDAFLVSFNDGYKDDFQQVSAVTKMLTSSKTGRSVQWVIQKDQCRPKSIPPSDHEFGFRNFSQRFSAKSRHPCPPSQCTRITSIQIKAPMAVISASKRLNISLLGGLEVPVDDLVSVQVVHAAGDLLGPVEQQGGWDLAAVPQHLVQLAVRTVLHDDAVARRLRAHSPETRETPMILEFLP